MNPKSRKSRRLGIESLESRKMMAGDVAVLLEGQLLTIRGDNAANQIVVAQNSLGHVTVSGQTGTLINGQSSVRLLNPQLNAIEVRMEGGDDLVTMRGVSITNDLLIDLGDGNDRLVTAANAPVTVGANATIEAGAGNDVIRLDALTVREDLSIEGGIGSLNVVLNGVSVDKALKVIGDDAVDIVSLSRVTVGDSLSIETKGGADQVTLIDLLAFNAYINTDANGVGADRVTLNRVQTQEDIGIFTGAGNDVVSLTDVTSAKSLTVSTDSGTDRVTSSRVRVAFDAVFEGGAGIDTFEDFGISAGVKKEVKEFEIRR